MDMFEMAAGVVIWLAESIYELYTAAEMSDTHLR
jgi:hypothetical protein